ncbi:MAG: RNA methyltransferase [Candidatus Ancillula sp.]|jgi:TrmH family RNA methyltransferase|nr:RNA methyltransferase [Candidatus Ancillula sp.]
MNISQLIENPDSAHIKRVRALYLKKNRQKFSRVIAEGVNAAEVLVNNHPEAVVEILVEESNPKSDGNASKWQKRLNQLVQSAQAKNLIVNYVTPRVMKSISENAEGVICIGKTIVFDDVRKNAGAKDVVVVCKETSDPGNAGMLIRACVAFGVSKVIFAGDSVDHWNPKVVRASVGAVFQVAIQNAPDLKTALKYLRDSGYSIVAADGVGTAQNVPHDLKSSAVLPKANSIAWLFGNEAHGLECSELDLADEVIRIEMLPNAVESLNLAGALHICLYETFVA